MRVEVGPAKWKSFLGLCCSGSLIYAGVSLYQGDEKFYERLVMPAARLLDGESAHNLAIFAGKYELVRNATPDSPAQGTTFCGLVLSNPIGMAAGFDKNAEAVDGLIKMGFGHVEIGTVTPLPQPGNPKPRVFRLLEDRAIINRYGFNSEGHEVVHARLQALKQTPLKRVVGVNLGKNKLAEDPIADYVQGVRRFADVADYFVVNVSSPNTPGLRGLQSKKELEALLEKVNEERQKIDRKIPLLIKIAPDLTEAELRDIAEVVRGKKTKIEGVIVSNTTVTRNNLKSQHKNESGGLSGAPLFSMSTRMVASLYQLTNGEVPIIGVGGIFTGEDAYTKIKAGASLVQIYTSFIYHGPPRVERIKRELAELLENDGHKDIKEAVGKEARLITEGKIVV